MVVVGEKRRGNRLVCSRQRLFWTSECLQTLEVCYGGVKKIAERP